jgi:hypothetical protein
MPCTRGIDVRSNANAQPTRLRDIFSTDRSLLGNLFFIRHDFTSANQKAEPWRGAPPLTLHWNKPLIGAPRHWLPGNVDRERIAPSPPTQTGRAVLPHPAFRFVAADELAQALDSRFGRSRYQPRWLSPRSPVLQAVHCGQTQSLQARYSGASGRTALRHYPDPCGMLAPNLATPRPYPPLLHGHYPLLRYYEGSDPDRSFDHRPWFPDSRHSNFQPFHLQSSADLCWTRPLPLRQQHYFVRTSPLLRRLVRYRRPNRVHILLHSRRKALRTGCSLSVASHPRLLPRRSYFQLLALQCQPGQGLSLCCSSALSGARGRAYARRPPQTRA